MEIRENETDFTVSFSDDGYYFVVCLEPNDAEACMDIEVRYCLPGDDDYQPGHVEEGQKEMCMTIITATVKALIKKYRFSPEEVVDNLLAYMRNLEVGK